MGSQIIEEVDDIETEIEEEREAELETDVKTEVEEPDKGSEEEVSDDESEDSNDDQKEGGEEDENDEESDHIVVSIEDGTEKLDDEEHKAAPKWVKDLRKQRRIDAKRIKELEKKLVDKDSTKLEKLGLEPTLESSDYDARTYEKRLKEWFEKKQKIELNQAEENKIRVQLQEEHNAKYNKYNTDKIALKVPDFNEAEEVVIDILSETQQGAILQGSEDPALLVYALGKNETQARKLAEIKDPVKFIFAAAKLEAQLKVSNRKKKPGPEKKVTGSGRSNSAVDSALERLRGEAEKTGDYTKVIAYKKKHRSAD